MLVVSGADAYRQLYKNIRAKTFNMPSKQDLAECVDGGIFPKLNNKLKLKPASKIFTIGSCFAREVEYVLLHCGFNVPSAQFSIPEGELKFSGPHLLNEYNVGTIVQRLESLTGEFAYDDKGIEFTDKGAIDLFLHVGSSPVSLERLQQRRGEIAELYRHVLTSDAVVITLGLVESWFDVVAGCYLNRAPSQAAIRGEPERFQFHRMDVEDVHVRMERAIRTLVDQGVRDVILTVSPVPVEATFMPDSCPIANGYSKAVLRVCAEMLSKAYDQVSYFPSLEIVNSFGTKGFLDDNVHVQPWVVHHIMHYWLANYLEQEAAAPPGSSAGRDEASTSHGMDPDEAGDTSIDLEQARDGA